MKNKYFSNSRCKMPLNLQFFAEGDEGNGAGAGGAGDGTGAGGASGEGTGAAGQEGNQGGASFDDFLKDGKNQAEFDRRVQKALETQRGKMQQEIQAQIENAKTEAEKLAKMNADQKAQYEREKREKELTDREAEITKRELTATAKETLVDKGLPIELASILNYTDADSCNSSIDAVEKAFKEAVQKAVEDKLRGGKPPVKAPEGSTTIFTADQISAMTPEEINRNWDAIQASMKLQK